MGARTASERQLILLAALAVACTVFGGVFLLVLLIFRMTHKLLQALLRTYTVSLTLEFRSSE